MPEARQVLTVSRLTHLVRDLLEQNFFSIWVEGEISNFSRPSSGHIYFTLKDEGSQIKAAMWRGANRTLRFTPKDGLKVLVKAKISVYPPQGSYQLIVEHMEEAGLGQLQREYEQLCQKLKSEGLFDSSRKRPLPEHVRHLAVITSPTGAAVRDIISVLKRRFPSLPVTIIPSLVQGNNAPAELINALNTANSHSDFDVILMSRGGGSLEDLWAFNNEALARAIAESRIPVISGVGHQTDFTITDFVADVRAPTPSAAAELLSQDADNLVASFNALETRFIRSIQIQQQTLFQQLAHLQKRLRHPGQRLNDYAQRLDGLDIRLQRISGRLISARLEKLNALQLRLNRQHPGRKLVTLQQHFQLIKQRLWQAQQRFLMNHKRHIKNLSQRVNAQYPGQRIVALQQQTQQLEQRLLRSWQQSHVQRIMQLKHLAERAHLASPLAILSRGYAVVHSDKGIIRSVKQIETGDTVQAQLVDGTITASVLSISTATSTLPAKEPS